MAETGIQGARPEARVKKDQKFARSASSRRHRCHAHRRCRTGKTILRDYIKATVGFEKLAEATGTPAKSLIRMLGPRGNPQARNLFSIIGYLQKHAGVELHVT